MTDRTVTLPAALILGLVATQTLAADGGAPDTTAQGALDGMVFVSTINVAEYDTPFADRMTFRDGTFFSEECQRHCDFGAEAYFTRVEADGIAFVADMACADAPQSVRWEGRVTGDRIEGTALWKVERFYWTVERQATFSGTLVPKPEEQAAIQTE